MEIVVFIFAGICAGLLAGLFGLGGGVIVVPALFYVMTAYHFPDHLIMHLAVGSSLATMVITSLASVRSHMKRGSVMFNLVFRFVPTLVVGVILGAILADYLSSFVLKIVFGVFLVLVSLYMGYKVFLKKPSNKHSVEKTPSQINISITSMVVGLFSGLLGVGAGSLAVPYLSFYHFDMKKIAGTVSMLSFCVALIGAVSVIVTGWNDTHMSWTAGYVYWPAVLFVGIASALFAPVGAFLSHKLPQIWLRRIFSILLFLIALDILFG